jgi:signal transduction histidine kinase
MMHRLARWLAGDRKREEPAPSGAPMRSYERVRRELDIARALELERQRIHDDLHDDIGSKLLTLLHRVHEPEQQQLVREVLQDLRFILARGRGGDGTVLEVLAQLRDETEQRLDTRAIVLDWRQSPDLPDPMLDAAQAMHLARICREAVTNAIRHAEPTRLRVVIERVDDLLVVEVTDDGQFEPERIGHGRGTRSMRARADELQGDIHWHAGTMGGTKVCLRFPLPRGEAGEPHPADQGDHGSATR